MNCKHCDYPLWNLRSRQCPECGTAFKPTEFRFAMNAVRYACPHCGQDYYGTGADGHLEPSNFECVGCGNRVDMDEMVLLPTEGVHERQTHADINPWLDEDRGFFSRWFGTLYRGAATPGWLLRSTPVDSDVGSAWAFAFFTHVAFGLIMLAPLFLLMIVVGLSGGGAASGGVFGFFIGVVFGTGVGSMIALSLWVVTAHGMLRVGGKTSGGIGRTAQALCYSCAPQMCVLAPCFLGIYFGWIGTLWWVVAAGFALAAAQNVGGLRAAVAVTVFPVVCGVLALTAVVLMATGIAAGAGTFYTSNDESVSAFRQPLRDSLSDGAWPAHAGELLLDGSVAIHQFTSALSGTAPADCVIDTASLAAWDGLAPSARRGMVDRAARAMPAQTVAHRLGDFVFTYHGVDPVSPPRDLWVVIEAWDPAVGGQRQRLVFVLTTQGSVRPFPRNTIGPELQAQNALRASHGLAPLPDPFSVRQGRGADTPPPEDPG